MATTGSAGTPGFDFGNLLATGLGIALPGVGGLIGNLGMQLFNSGSSSTSSQMSGNTNMITDKLANITRQQGYNAAGKVGNEVEPSYAAAKASLTNTAEARNAYNNQNNLAGRMLSSLQNSADATTNSAETMAGNQIRNLARVARDGGGSAGAISAISQSIGEQLGQNIGQVGANLAGQATSVADAASKAYGSASDTLMKDLEQQYQQNVKPYEMQVNGSQNVLGTAQQTTQQSSQDAAMYQPLAGLSNALGALGGQYMGQNQGNVMGGIMDKIRGTSGASDAAGWGADSIFADPNIEYDDIFGTWVKRSRHSS